jgi:acyl-coenzyme A thioesterase PaaI-like protein
VSDAVFTADGDTYVPSGHARGPWDRDAMHGGAPVALAARAIEALEAPVPMRCVRLAAEFAGAVPLTPVTVAARLGRAGRRLAFAEAEVAAAGRVAVRVRATLLRVADVDVPSAPESALPGPEAARPGRWPRAAGADQGFHLSAMEVRFLAGGWGVGPATAWFRLLLPLVAGEEPSPLQRVAAAADFGNGLSRALDFDTHLFVNTDLTVHLHREATGPWVAVEARTALDGAGVGQATTVLHDERGRLGIGAQSLFVERRGPG